ncbi:ABC transporter transmembrane domain-containing protein [Streptococcus tangpeifui]|uniref:ABC transporter transmembrane domain-containing protein n=1 Tax=Streptococcus tangpeifui TaxID=2709400 RepID=UPI0013EDB677|nr:MULTISPECIES: ABC transporter ATP-binding protein [unclassified Streptococcus]
MIIFRKFIRYHKFQFTLIVFLIILGNLLSLPIPYISKMIIDKVLILKQFNSLYYYIILIVVVLFFQFVVGRINSILSATFFQRFLLEIRKQILSENNIESLSDNSNITTVIFNDSELYVSNIENIVVTFISSIGLFMGYLIMLLRLNIQLTLPVLIVIPTYVLWIIYAGKKLKTFSFEQQFSRDQLLNTLKNITTNLEVIRVFRMFDKIRSDFWNVINNNFIINSKIRGFQNFIEIISTGIVSSTTILIFVLGVNFIGNGIFSIGDLVAFNSYSGLIFGPVTQLINLWAVLSISRTYEARILLYLNKVTDSSYIVNFDNLSAIELSDFSVYSGNSSILRGINLILHNGECILLKGENGTGKSLFLKSLANIYNNYTGCIRLEEKNGDSLYLKLNSSQKLGPHQIVYLSNNQGFPLKTLKEEFSSLLSSDEEIYDLLKSVGIYERILSLDKGLNISSQELRNYLSLGELQKLRIARAISYKPKLLILDEIFSNIDYTSMDSLLSVIKSKLPDSILLIVDHHIIKGINFDRVLKIHDNTIK